MNEIHPSAVIGPHVTIGKGNVIGPHVVLSGHTTIGNDNWIGPASCIGIRGDILGRPRPSDGPFWSTDATDGVEAVIIGSNNVIKEHVTIHAGSHRATRIGNDCYLMPRAHLGHDCWLGDNVLLSPSAQVAGHVAIGTRSVVGMGALVHQFSSIGPVSMVGMGCCVRGAVEPCRTVVGEPHKVTGINKVGLSRFLGEEDAKVAFDALRRRDDSLLPRTLGLAVEQWRANIAQQH